MSADDQPRVTADFLADVDYEADFQQRRWGVAHDASKTDDEWYWTIGYLLGKAVLDPTQDTFKQRHRIRAAAAALMQWDKHIAAREVQP